MFRLLASIVFVWKYIQRCWVNAGFEDTAAIPKMTEWLWNGMNQLAILSFSHFVHSRCIPESHDFRSHKSLKISKSQCCQLVISLLWLPFPHFKICNLLPVEPAWLRTFCTTSNVIFANQVFWHSAQTVCRCFEFKALENEKTLCGQSSIDKSTSAECTEDLNRVTH